MTKEMNYVIWWEDHEEIYEGHPDKSLASIMRHFNLSNWEAARELLEKTSPDEPLTIGNETVWIEREEN